MQHTDSAVSLVPGHLLHARPPARSRLPTHPHTHHTPTHPPMCLPALTAPSRDIIGNILRLPLRWCCARHARVDVGSGRASSSPCCAERSGSLSAPDHHCAPRTALPLPTLSACMEPVADEQNQLSTAPMPCPSLMQTLHPNTDMWA